MSQRIFFAFLEQCFHFTAMNQKIKNQNFEFVDSKMNVHVIDIKFLRDIDLFSVVTIYKTVLWLYSMHGANC